MITIQVRSRSPGNGRSCATCRYYSIRHSEPGDEPEPYCSYLGQSLARYSHILTKVFCARWDRLPDEQAVKVYEELTGVEL